MTEQTPGRQGNDAQPLGRRSGEDTEAKVLEAGKKEQRSAGPDGPEAATVGDTFKAAP